MKVKRSGRVMVTTTVVLFLFTCLVIWHDKPPRSNQNQGNAIQSLIQNYPELKTFLDQIDVTGGSGSFYSVGLQGEQGSPGSIRRACYLDPLAAWWQFAAIQKSYAKKIEVVRYRSPADFFVLLLNQELQRPGYIRNLNLSSHTPIREDPYAVSLRSAIAVLVGLLGLTAVRWVTKGL